MITRITLDNMYDVRGGKEEYSVPSQMLDSNILLCIQEFLPMEWSENKVHPCYKL